MKTTFKKEKTQLQQTKSVPNSTMPKLPITKRPKIYTEIYPSSKNQLKYAKTAKLNFTKQVDKLNFTKLKWTKLNIAKNKWLKT